MKRKLLLLCLLAFQASLAQVTVSIGYDGQQLIQGVLIGNPNFPATNFEMMNGNQYGGPNSIGVFNCTNPSIIPFEDGIILSTGNASGIVGLPTALISTAGNAWPGDSELETIAATSDLYNASSLKFDFIAEVPAISFDFMMASEEYNGTFECNFSDIFAFIVTNNSTGVSENVAVVPGTSTPISISTVNINPSCSANASYFAQYNAAGFNGQTVVFVLTGDLTIGDSYTVKIVIADHGDKIYDSALFVRNSSFGAYPVVDQEPNDLFITDSDADGFEVFDLTSNETLILGPINPEVYSFDFAYYHTLSDAEAQLNPIPNPQA